jgi:hypothetical protein
MGLMLKARTARNKAVGDEVIESCQCLIVGLYRDRRVQMGLRRAREGMVKIRDGTS